MPAASAAPQVAIAPLRKSSGGAVPLLGCLAAGCLILVGGVGGVVGYRLLFANRAPVADAGSDGAQDEPKIASGAEKRQGAPQPIEGSDGLPRIDAGEVFGDSTPAAKRPQSESSQPSSPSGLPKIAASAKRVVSTGSADVIQLPPPGGFVDASFSPDGTMLATLDVVGSVILWDLKTREGLEVPLTPKGGMYNDDAPHMVFSPDGATLVVGCPASVAVIDVKDARVRWEKGNRRESGRLLVSPTAKTVALFEGDNGNVTANTRLSVFDVATGKPLLRDTPWKYLESGELALSPDGKLMAAFDGSERVRLFDLVAGKEAGAAGGIRGGAQNMAFLPDSRTLVLPRVLQLWDVSNPEKPKLVHRAGEEGLNFARLSPDGKTLYGIQRGQRFFWDVEKRRKRADVSGSLSNTANFSIDSRTYAAALSGSTPSVVVVDSADGATITVFEIGKGPNAKAACVALSADGKQLAIGTGNEVLLKSLPAGTPSAEARELASLRFAPPEYLRKQFEDPRLADQEFANDMWFTPDGRHLVVRGGYSTVWNLAEKRQELVLMLNDGRGRKINDSKSPPPGVAGSGFELGPGSPFPAPFAGGYLRPDGKTLTVCSRSMVIDYDLTTGTHLVDGSRPRCTLIVPAPNGAVAAAVVERSQPGKSNDEIVIVDAKDSTIKKSLGIWKPRSFYDPHTYQWMAFSPDSRLLAAAVSERSGLGERLMIWDWQTGNEVPTTANVPQDRIEFADNGKALCTISGSAGRNGIFATANVYDMDSGSRDHEIDLRAGHTVPVRGLAFSPTQPLFATADADGMVLLRDLATGNARARWKGHDADITAVAFSHDGRQLATAASDRTVKVWDMAGTFSGGK
jgi:WD40 repeat protein